MKGQPGEGWNRYTIETRFYGAFILGDYSKMGMALSD